MKTKNLLVMGAVALVAGVFSACGGSGNSGSGAESGIPTDGILGELPALNERWAAESEELLGKLANEENDDKRTELNRQLDEWEKARKEKALEVKGALDGKEIPTEVADGVPVVFDGNLKLSNNGSVEGYRTKGGVTMFAKGIGSLTADLADKADITNYHFVAYDAEGNAIDVATAVKEYKGDKSPFDAGKAGDTYQFQMKVYANAEWSRLAKLVLVDKESDAYQQAEAQAKGE